ncbi:MAG TPA: metallophosphoesterase [Bacteroidota bacterium]|jgi:hypothetical protein|nr:metallophosphoesterase [Bacteroidota bacterium]
MFILFFSVVSAVYSALNYYIFYRGGSVIPERYKLVYVVAGACVSGSYVAGRILERFVLSWVSDLLVWLGSFWLAAMVYFLLACLCIDLLRLVNLIVPIFPSFVTNNLEQTKQIIFWATVSVVGILVLAGHINARTIRIKTLELTVSKNAHSSGTMNIAVASDIHLGTIICKARLERIVQIINGLDPDLVLLPGDIVDEDLGPVIKQNLGETLRTIRSRLGVLAITGNHEYIGGVEEACRYLTEHGIRLLRDEVTIIDGSLNIVGREDRSIRQFQGKSRKTLEELMSAVDKSCPVILMDHQPFRLDEAVENHIDLQLSGHTHHGQLWPFNFITKKVYELSWGYLKKRNTHFYVSCGVGTWGPPVRIGNRPEVVNVRLRLG